MLDEWVAKLAEDEVQSLPEAIAVECHLGAGDTKADFDPARATGTVRLATAGSSTWGA